MENTNRIQRSELWEKIYNVVKQIPREAVQGDAMDASSATTEIEKIFSSQLEPPVSGEAGVTKALKHLIAAIYFDDNSDFGSAIWNAIKELNKDAYNLLEEDEQAAYDKYCEDESQREA